MKTALGTYRVREGRYLLSAHYIALCLVGDNRVVISKFTTNSDLSVTLVLAEQLYTSDLSDAADRMREMEERDEAREHGVKLD